MNILIASGVNLDLLGRREPEIYGHDTLDDMQDLLKSEWPDLKKSFGDTRTLLEFFQTNSEAELLTKLSEKKWAGVVLNAGAWTHTSLALADRLVGLSLCYVEVHVSNTHIREPFRHKSYLAPHAIGVIQGFGIRSYLLGLEALVRHLRSQKKKRS